MNTSPPRKPRPWPALGAQAALQGRRIKVEFAADLGDLDSDFAETGLERLGLEAIGVPFAPGGALVRSSAESRRAFDLHAVIEQQAHRVGHGLRALLIKLVHDLVE